MERLNIICIDDQQNVLYTLQRDLTFFQSDLNLSFCESASEACQVIEELSAAGQYIAVVICDHIMPEKNGIDFLIELKEEERFSAVKTVLLTGLATHQDTIRAINQAHIDRYIEKPWNGKHLVDTIKTLITEFIFKVGLDYVKYAPYLDEKIVLERLHNPNIYSNRND